MTLIAHNGTLILRDGVLASNADCCCNCVDDLDCPEGQYCCFGSCNTQPCSPCDYNECLQCYPEYFLDGSRTQSIPYNPPLDPPCQLFTAVRFQSYSGAPLNNQPPCFFSWSWNAGWPDKLADCQYVWVRDVLNVPCYKGENCYIKRKERYRLFVMTCPDGNGELVDITADAVNGSLECESCYNSINLQVALGECDDCAEYPAYFDTPAAVCDP